MQVIISSTKRVLVGNLTVADSIFKRAKGLLGRTFLASDSGLLLKPCKAVHTFGMKFAIDVVFLDKENRVIDVIETLKPNRMTAIYCHAATVLELSSGSTSQVQLAQGDYLEITD